VAFNGLKILGAFAPDSESTHGAGDFVGTVETGGSAICATITTGFTPNGNIPAIINSGTIAAHALTGTPLVSGSFCGNLTGGNFGQLGLVAIADLGINWRTSGSCATAKADASMVAVLAVVPAGALTQGAGGLKDEVVGAAYSDRLGEPSPCIDVTAGLTDSNACVQL
jgi:hypothetical protein